MSDLKYLRDDERELAFKCSEVGGASMGDVVILLHRLDEARRELAEQRWISVSKLPSMNQKLKGKNKFWMSDKLWLYSPTHPGGQGYVYSKDLEHFAWKYAGSLDASAVTYWRPLPAPPGANSDRERSEPLCREQPSV